MPRYTIYVGDSESTLIKYVFDTCDVSDVTDGVAITCKSGNVYRFVDDETNEVTVKIRSDKIRRYEPPNLIGFKREVELYGLK